MTYGEQISRPKPWPLPWLRLMLCLLLSFSSKLPSAHASVLLLRPLLEALRPVSALSHLEPEAAESRALGLQVGPSFPESESEACGRLYESLYPGGRGRPDNYRRDVCRPYYPGSGHHGICFPFLCPCLDLYRGPYRGLCPFYHRTATCHWAYFAVSAKATVKNDEMVLPSCL